MTTIDTYKDSRGKWRWTATAPNGQTIGASSQGFTRASSARKNAYRLMLALIEEFG